MDARDLGVYECFDQPAVDVRAEALLSPSAGEAAENLLLGILQVAASGTLTTQPFCRVVRASGQLVGIAVRTPPMPLMLSDMPLEAALTLAPALLSSIDAEGSLMINGPAELTDALSLALTEAHDLSRGPGQRMRLFELRQVLLLPRPQGAMRLAEAADHALVLAWFDAFVEEATPHESGLRNLERQVTDAISGSRVFLWESGGRSVALAQRSRDTGHGASIGPVYTPPAMRGHGYATALVAELSQLILDEGKSYTCLFTDLANPISNRIYPRIGYREVSDFAQWRLSRA
jgi:predicted GNAT family acetyltransferase